MMFCLQQKICSLGTEGEHGKSLSDYILIILISRALLKQRFMYGKSHYTVSSGNAVDKILRDNCRHLVEPLP